MSDCPTYPKKIIAESNSQTKTTGFQGTRINIARAPGERGQLAPWHYCNAVLVLLGLRLLNHLADPYSFLMATAGSTRDALSAGIEQARRTAAKRPAITARRWLSLYALILKSMLRMSEPK